MNRSYIDGDIVHRTAAGDETGLGVPDPYTWAVRALYTCDNPGIMCVCVCVCVCVFVCM